MSSIALKNYWINTSSHFRYITIPVHLLFILSAVLYFKLNVSRSFLISIPLLWFIFSGLGISIGYHRLLSHRSFQTTQFIKRLLAVCGMFACQGSPIFWAAVHRGLHHPFADTIKDPHTPQKGFWYSYFSWQAYFSVKDFDPRFAIDLIRDPFLKKISLHYYKFFWISLGIVFLISWKFFFLALVPALIISSHQENIINSFCHTDKFGYKNFETKDQSRNIWLLGIVFFGQGFHNNHHAKQSEYSFGHYWWEVDICKYLIFFLKKSENLDKNV